MASVQLADIFWLGVVTLMSCGMLARFARLVGNMRMKHKITPPDVTGPPEFIRSLRAQQNSLEFFVVFIPMFWIAGVFFHQIPVAVVSSLFLWHRWNYFNEYVKDAKARLRPFKQSIRMLLLLLLMAVVGLINTGAIIYADTDLLKLAKKTVGKVLTPGL